jgi:hypothetical protein
VLSTTKTQWMSIAQDIDGPSFYYGHPSSHYTSDLIATSNYYTTLLYDKCVAIFFRLCGHATKSLEHMEVLEGSWYMKNQLFGSFLGKMF